MTTIDIQNEPCKCVDFCEAGCEDMRGCVNKLEGEVRTLKCKECNAYTWHQNGVCLREKLHGNKEGL